MTAKATPFTAASATKPSLNNNAKAASKAAFFVRDFASFGSGENPVKFATESNLCKSGYIQAYFDN